MTRTYRALLCGTILMAYAVAAAPGAVRAASDDVWTEEKAGPSGASASAESTIADPLWAWNFAWFSEAGSNVFSNVPFVLVAGKWINNFAQPELMWKVMALTTTFAGNLTIVGSVANIIVVESARGHVELGFWDYARYGIPVTILTTVVGMLILLWLR